MKNKIIILISILIFVIATITYFNIETKNVQQKKKEVKGKILKKNEDPAQCFFKEYKDKKRSILIYKILEENKKTDFVGIDSFTSKKDFIFEAMSEKDYLVAYEPTNKNIKRFYKINNLGIIEGQKNNNDIIFNDKNIILKIDCLNLKK